MATLFRDGMKPPQKVLEIIVGYMNRVASPVYLGILSLEVRYSLERTQQMMDLLEEQGIVRPVTPEEKRARGLPAVAHLYVLIEKPSMSRGYR